MQPLRIVVIGAGAAGMVAAAEAADRGAAVILLEKNTKTGVKILMSGGTRCNLTHDTDASGITNAFGHAKRFLQKSVGSFPPRDVVAMFNRLGVATKTESTGKIFPQSDRAVQVRDALHSHVVRSGAQIRLQSPVKSVRPEGDVWKVATDSTVINADRVIVTAGGRSWPGCGTTGDAYDWMSKLGHTIVSTRPALVPLVGGYPWTKQLSGITLEDCVASVRKSDSSGKKKPLIERRSSWLFTHFGFSGPAAMDVSGTMTAAHSIKDVQLCLDLLPQISIAELDGLLSDRSADGGRRTVASVVAPWLPSRLVNALSEHSGGNCCIAQMSNRIKHNWIDNTKRLQLPISGTRGFAKAEVTAGGVSLAEVDPRTMASRVADGLFIAGEVLDVDGWIGGYNFQAAFATGRAAAIGATTVVA